MIHALYDLYETLRKRAATGSLNTAELELALGTLDVPLPSLDTIGMPHLLGMLKLYMLNKVPDTGLRYFDALISEARREKER